MVPLLVGDYVEVSGTFIGGRLEVDSLNAKYATFTLVLFFDLLIMVVVRKFYPCPLLTRLRRNIYANMLQSTILDYPGDKTNYL